MITLKDKDHPQSVLQDVRKEKGELENAFAAFDIQFQCNNQALSDS